MKKSVYLLEVIAPLRKRGAVGVIITSEGRGKYKWFWFALVADFVPDQTRTAAEDFTVQHFFCRRLRTFLVHISPP
jgi:hypothetical protein